MVDQWERLSRDEWETEVVIAVWPFVVLPPARHYKSLSLVPEKSRLVVDDLILP